MEEVKFDTYTYIHSTDLLFIQVDHYYISVLTHFFDLYCSRSFDQFEGFEIFG